MASNFGCNLLLIPDLGVINCGVKRFFLRGTRGFQYPGHKGIWFKVLILLLNVDRGNV